MKNFISENLKVLQLTDLAPDLSKHDWLKRIFTLRKTDKPSLIFHEYLNNHYKSRKDKEKKRK